MYINARNKIKKNSHIATEMHVYVIDELNRQETKPKPTRMVEKATNVRTIKSTDSCVNGKPTIQVYLPDGWRPADGRKCKADGETPRERSESLAI